MNVERSVIYDADVWCSHNFENQYSYIHLLSKFSMNSAHYLRPGVLYWLNSLMHWLVMDWLNFTLYTVLIFNRGLYKQKWHQICLLTSGITKGVYIQIVPNEGETEVMRLASQQTVYVFFFLLDRFAEVVSTGVAGRDSCFSILWTSSIPRFWKRMKIKWSTTYPQVDNLMTYLALGWFELGFLWRSQLLLFLDHTQ